MRWKTPCSVIASLGYQRGGKIREAVVEEPQSDPPPIERPPLRREVLRLALPLIGSDLLQRGVNVVDALLVGRLGAAELAAVGLAHLLLTIALSLVYGLGVGVTVMVA